MQMLFLFNRHGCWRVVSSTFIHLIAACGLVLTALPSALAGVTTTGDVTPQTITFDTDLYVADQADGTLQIDGGSEVRVFYTHVGNAAGATGLISIDGAGSSFKSSFYLYLGVEGTGILQLSGGATSTCTWPSYIGYEAGSTGSISVADPDTLLDFDQLHLGYRGDGSLSVTAGGSVDTFFAFIGDEATATGAATVDGVGSSMTCVRLYTGYHGSGMLDITDGGEVSANVDIGYEEGSTGKLSVSGAGSLLTCTSDIRVGYKGDGTLNISAGGQVITNRDSDLGGWYGGTGTVNVDGTDSTWTSTGDLYVGSQGDGALAITAGGKVFNEEGEIGHGTGTVGQVTVDGTGSTWANSGDLFVGCQGDGTLVISNGGQVNCLNAFIGYGAPASGDVTVEGAGSLLNISGDLQLGRSSSGTLSLINGGRTEVSGATYVGYFDTTPSTLTFDNGTLDTGLLLASAADLHGQGVVNTHGLVSDVDLVFDQSHGPQQQLILNGEPGQNIAINLDQTSAGSLGVGFTGSRTLTIADGRQIESANGYLGYREGGNGAATVDGIGTLWHCYGDLYVGYAGAGSLTISSGGQVIADGLTRVRPSNGSPGSIHFDSGTLDTETLQASPAVLHGQGAINTHGLLTDMSLLFDQTHPAQQQYVLNSEPGQTITINLDHNASGGLGVGMYGSGDLTIRDGVTIHSAFGKVGYAAGSTGTATVTGTDTTWNCANGLAVGLVGVGSLEILDGGRVNCGYLYTWSSDGASTVTVDGADSVLLTGEVRIGGSTDYNSSVTLANGGRLEAYRIRVLPFGLLTGDGAITGYVDNRGRVAPGQSPGTLQIVGNYLGGYGQASEGTLDIELAAKVNDLLEIIGSASLNGTLSVTLYDGFMPSLGQSFTILTASSITGMFVTELLPSLDGGYLDVIYNSDSVVLTVIPEPASLLLLLTGGSLLVRHRPVLV
ncbi:MAG: hypothetical protein IT445_01425 [Phycisphaeraceae bacterium]|nr:hypothetical protein [Phycisphaeraceae bacterium]